jgi:peptidoglycan/xylan/chitin deacetylase (PgdA/CDA1 family)
VGGGSGDELDLSEQAFVAQMDALLAGGHDVVSLDAALDRLDVGDDRPSVVLTFDDGFADVARVAFPRLVDRELPFTLYFAAGLAGGAMRWEGSSGRSQGESALTWDEVGELVASGLCTIGNHTWDHPGPEQVDASSLDRCSDAIEARLGLRPAHFAWTWGIPVPHLMPAVRERFRSAATGSLGRNLPGTDRHALARIPVRATDPLRFFRAKLRGDLGPERAYASVVHAAKAARGRASVTRSTRPPRG